MTLLQIVLGRFNEAPSATNTITQIILYVNEEAPVDASIASGWAFHFTSTYTYIQVPIDTKPSVKIYEYTGNQLYTVQADSRTANNPDPGKARQASADPRRSIPP